MITGGAGGGGGVGTSDSSQFKFLLQTLSEISMRASSKVSTSCCFFGSI